MENNYFIEALKKMIFFFIYNKKAEVICYQSQLFINYYNNQYCTLSYDQL